MKKITNMVNKKVIGAGIKLKNFATRKKEGNAVIIEAIILVIAIALIVIFRAALTEFLNSVITYMRTQIALFTGSN